MKAIAKQAVTAVVLGASIAGAHAQQAVTSDLDSCINSEKVSYTVKGAAAGAFTGVLTSFLGGKKDNAGKAALVGAVAGGAIGYATAYYKAAGICMQKNPSWVPESNIQRTSNYEAIISEFKYTPAKGDFIVARKLQVPEAVKQGGVLEVKAKFVVLTPDGSEAKVKIVHKLFVIADNKEEEVPFFGKGVEERVVENGEHEDKLDLPIDKEAPIGSKFRIEYRISLKDANFVSESATVEVR